MREKIREIEARFSNTSTSATETKSGESGADGKEQAVGLGRPPHTAISHGAALDPTLKAFVAIFPDAAEEFEEKELADHVSNILGSLFGSSKRGKVTG